MQACLKGYSLNEFICKMKLGIHLTKEISVMFLDDVLPAHAKKTD